MDTRLLDLNLKNALLALSDLALPRVCAVCGRELTLQERCVCLCCLSDIPRTFFETWRENPMALRYNALLGRKLDRYEAFSDAVALFYYRTMTPYARITRRLKYDSDFDTGRLFAGMLAQALVRSPRFFDVDLIVPVPLHWTRHYRRGYNQAEIIAKEIGSVLGAEVRKDILRRSRRTGTQTRLDLQGKAENVQGAFKARRPEGLRSEHILLVDDVYTTGSTLSECHLALRRVFPSVRISIATLAFVGD